MTSPGSARSYTGARETSENDGVRAIVTASLVLACGIALAPHAGATSTLSFTVETLEGLTTVHPHPPAGGVGDAYASTLELVNDGMSQLGKGARAKVGTMQFTYTIRRQCAVAAGCVSTADFDTVTTLPGGKVIASGRSIPISSATITIPVTGGTGRFVGAKGSVTISPTRTKRSTYTLELP
jgi:hypothetical protein